MNKQNVVIHKFVSGDTLYSLAKKYNITVDSIVAANPYLDPYRLKIGDEIFIYPGENVLMKNIFTMSQVDLMNNMRKLWEQHSLWTRSLIVSIADNLKDIDYVTKRLLRNPSDIGNLYRRYYGDEVGDKITNLLREHLVIGGELVKAASKHDMNRAGALNNMWYKNADDMALAFSSINPNYVQSEVRDMLYHHLDLVKNEATYRLTNNYDADIKTYDDIENQALMMADYFADGIINQFPSKFI